MDTQRPLLEKVESALAEAYGSGGTNASRDLAQKWILDFQEMSEAWNISILLLKNKNNPVAQYFGAQTLEIKLRSHWSQLGRDQQFELLRILLQHLKMFSQSSPMVLTRLCVAISQMAINLVPKDWPKMFEDLLPLSQPPQNTAAIDPRSAFLELWRVVPEEVGTAAITEEKRKNLTSYIFGLVPSIMPIIEGFIRTESLPLKVKAMKCLNSWILFEIPVAELLKMPIIGTIYECLESINIQYNMENQIAELITDAVDVLSAVIQSNSMVRYPTAVLLMLQKAIALFPKYQAAVQVKDYRIARAYCSLFSTCCEQHVKLLIDDKELGIPLIKIIIECSANPDQDIATLPTSFWFEFQETLIDEYDDVKVSNFAPFHELMALGLLLIDLTEKTQKEFSEAFIELVKILRQQIIIPLEHEDWTDHDWSEFISFRHTIADAMLHCYNVVKSTCFEIFISGLQMQLNTAKDDWRAVESYLFGIYAISESAAPEMNLSEYIKPIMEMFPAFPLNKYLYLTAIRVLGEYSKWIKKHQQYIGRALQFTMGALNEPYLSTVAAKTFNQLTKACQSSIGQQDLTLLDTASKALLNSNLLKRTTDRCYVMEALSIVILTQFPFEQTGGMLRALTAPIIERIKLSLQNPSPTNEIKLLLRSDLKTFAHAFYSFSMDENTEENEEDDEDAVKIKVPPGASNLPHPFLAALQDAWPIVEIIAQTYGKDEKMIETICKLFLQLTRSLNKIQFQVLLPSTLNMIYSIFSRNHTSAILSLFGTLLYLYKIPTEVEKQMNTSPSLPPHLENEFTQKFAELLVLLSQTTIDVVQKDVHTTPDLLKSYFDLLVMIKKTNPLILYGPQNVTMAGSDEQASLIWIVYQFALALILRCPHPQASRSIFAFINTYCNEDDARFAPTMTQIIEKSMPQLLANLFKAISGGVQKTQSFPLIAQLVYTLSSRYSKQYMSDLTILFNLDEFPSKYISNELKAKYLKQLFNSLHDFKAIEAVLHDITAVCRNKKTS